jgi:hypothetical protein
MRFGTQLQIFGARMKTKGIFNPILQKSPFSNLATMWGHPPPPPPYAREKVKIRLLRGRSDFDVPKNRQNLKTNIKKQSTSAKSDFDVPKNLRAPPGPLRGPSGARRAPPGPLRGPLIFECNRHCRTSPVVLEGFWGQVWPKINRKPQKS